MSHSTSLSLTALLVSAPVYRPDGEQVATGNDDMWSGSIAVPINLNESGQQTGNTWVWTGTEQNRNRSHSWRRCANGI